MFKKFIASCLTRDPVQRPSGAQLLEHFFMIKEKLINGQPILADIVRRARILREKKKMGIEYDDDDEDDRGKPGAIEVGVHPPLKDLSVTLMR